MSRQTPNGLGSAIAEAAVLEGDPARVNTDLEALQHVSAADVQRVMRTYVARRPQGDDRLSPGRGREMNAASHARVRRRSRSLACCLFAEPAGAQPFPTAAAARRRRGR